MVTHVIVLLFNAILLLLSCRSIANFLLFNAIILLLSCRSIVVFLSSCPPLPSWFRDNLTSLSRPPPTPSSYSKNLLQCVSSTDSRPAASLQQQQQGQATHSKMWNEPTEGEPDPPHRCPGLVPAPAARACWRHFRQHRDCRQEAKKDRRARGGS